MSLVCAHWFFFFFFFQAEDGIRDYKVTGVQTCALPIYDDLHSAAPLLDSRRPSFSSVGRHGLSERNSAQANVRNEGGPPPQLAESPDPVQPGPVRNRDLLQPTAVASTGTRAVTPLLAPADPRRDSERKGEALFTIAGVWVGTESRVPDPHQRDPRDPGGLQR